MVTKTQQQPPHPPVEEPFERPLEEPPPLEPPVYPPEHPPEEPPPQVPPEIPPEAPPEMPPQPPQKLMKQRLRSSGGQHSRSCRAPQSNLCGVGPHSRTFEKYVRIARPEIDPLALGEPRLPITLARELDLDAPGAVPALQLDAHHAPGRPHIADHRFDAAAVGMAIDIDLVGTRVDLGRDIVDAVEVPTSTAMSPIQARPSRTRPWKSFTLPRK